MIKLKIKIIVNLGFKRANHKIWIKSIVWWKNKKISSLK